MRFRLESRQDCNLIHFDTNLDQAAIPDYTPLIREAVDKVMNQKSGPVILDFKGKATIDRSFIVTISPFSQQLSAKHKCFYAINLPAAALELLQAAKLKHPIRVVASVAQAIDEASAPGEISTHMDLINAIKNGVVGSFKNVAKDLVVTPGKAIVRTSMNAIQTDIAATTEITAIKADITYALCFTEKVFISILSEMHGEKYTTFTPEMNDGALELVNITTSVAKKQMSDASYVLTKQIPQSVKGALIDKLFSVASCVIIIPFETKYGAFHVQLSVSNR